MAHPIDSEVRAQVEELGGDLLTAALDELVSKEEEWVVTWFDAKEEQWEADEILDWSVVQIAMSREPVAYVELRIELSAYSADDEEQPMQVIAIPGFARVLQGPPLVADRLELKFGDLSSWVAADRAEESGQVEPFRDDPE